MKNLICVMILVFGVAAFAQNRKRQGNPKADAKDKADSAAHGKSELDAQANAELDTQTETELDELFQKLDSDLASQLKVKKPKSYDFLSRAYFQLLHDYNSIFTSKGDDGKVSRMYILDIANLMLLSKDGDSSFEAKKIINTYSELVIANNIQIDKLKQVNVANVIKRNKALTSLYPKSTPPPGAPR